MSSRPFVALTVLAGIVASGALLTGCTATAAQFANGAQKFITSAKVAQYASLSSFSHPACVKPADTKRDTTFQCTADGSDGHSYVFQLAIVGDRQFKILSIQPKS